ncbi:MAG: glycosyltransferase family 2 protein [Elusimicrobia bacterium]|nr:glycosyltransferase family 2 protein [Elusimicrobiota bacterium]
MRFAVIIPTYNPGEPLEHSLEELAPWVQKRKGRILIVDNASQDGCVEKLRPDYPDITLLKNESNLGFSKAVNAGIRKAEKAEVIVLLNQDCRLATAFADPLIEFFENAPKDIGIAGGQLFNPDGSLQPCCGPFPTLWSTLWRMVLPKRHRKYYINSDRGLPCRVDWVTGAFLAFPRRVWKELGGLDENFFMYYEDVDFSLRALQRGYRTFLLPQVKAIHLNPHAQRTGEEVPERLQLEIRKSQMLYFFKHRPRWEYWAIRQLNAIYMGAKAMRKHNQDKRGGIAIAVFFTYLCNFALTFLYKYVKM